MQYIVNKRLKGMSLSGEINLPYGTVVEEKNRYLYNNSKPVCVVSSENGRNHFSRNDDGKGLERGKLVHAIIDKLAVRDEDYQSRWDKIWEDYLCKPLKRPEHEDHWLWNEQFYEADISVLTHIYKLIGGDVNGV